MKPKKPKKPVERTASGRPKLRQKFIGSAKYRDQLLLYSLLSKQLDLVKRGIQRSRFWSHYPHEKQKLFLELSDVREVFYGGSAGGGKSDAMLMAAAQYVHIPGYAAIIFRKTFSDLKLPGAIYDRAMEWWDGVDGVTHNRDLKTFVFDTGKNQEPATITFAYLQHEQDKMRYKSAEFQFIGFDELTQFSEPTYLFLFSRLRRLSGMDVPLRMRGSSNPGDIGHDWVRARFIKSDKCFRLESQEQVSAMWAHVNQGKDHNRVFVPAALEDNPSLDRESYEEGLSQLDYVTYQQMRFGNWETRPKGILFKRAQIQIIDWEAFDGVQHPRIEDLWKLRYWDLAATEEPEEGKPGNPDYTAGGKHLFDPETGRLYVAHMVHRRVGPGEVENEVKTTAMLDGPEIPHYIEQEPGASGKMVVTRFINDVLRGFSADGRLARIQKAIRWRPLIAAYEHGKVFIVRGDWNQDYVDELRAATGTDETHDDQVDTSSGALEVFTEFLNGDDPYFR